MRECNGMGFLGIVLYGIGLASMVGLVVAFAYLVGLLLFWAVLEYRDRLVDWRSRRRALRSIMGA